VASGPLYGSVRISRRLHHSTMVQQITLRENSRVIEFATEIDWQERHKLLKVVFPVDIYAQEAIHEIQFGHLARPNHRSRPYDADRFEVANHKWTALAEPGRGCAILNDCKYGISVDGQEIRLTLLKSAMAPDMSADRGTQAFTYAFTAWQGPLVESSLVHDAYELNTPVSAMPGDAGHRSLFAIDHPGVVIEAIKPAEDGSQDLVLRLYEARRTATRCTLSSSLRLRSARATDMLEQGGDPLAVQDGQKIALAFRPFEIKTIRLVLA